MDELVQLRQQIADARAMLTQLEGAIADAESRLDATRAVQLVQANEHLVMAALSAQAEAEAKERTQNELRAEVARKDDFLATLAHELRNPLAPIRNGVHILQQCRDLSPELQKIHGMLDRQVTHLVRLVEDLLEVSRVTRGQIELRCENVEVAKAINHALEVCQTLIERAGHTVEISPIPEALTVYADPVRFCQVLSNLINNATRYTAAGGQIRVGAERYGSEVHIFVSDNGNGLAPERLPTIFELFSHRSQPNSRTQGGLGIGLALTKALVEMQRGTIEARSDGLGRGSTFLVKLPLAVGEATSLATRHNFEALTFRPKLLVIDDNHDAADSLQLVLESLGAEVQVAYDGPSGLALLEGMQPSAVLIDIGMPGMDGHEVAHRIRAMPSRSALKLIALTGWGEERDRRLSQAAGFNHHLVKPADLQELGALLSALGP